MSITAGLLAMVLLGEVGPASPGQDAPPIAYRIRYVGTSGALTLQEALYTNLQPVARQGGATVWAIDEEFLHGLLELIQGEVSSNLVQAPTMIWEAGATGYVENADGRIAADTPLCLSGQDGPEEASRCPTQAEPVRFGNRLTITGRPTDQGILAHLTIEDTRVAAVHKVRVDSRVETLPIEGLPGLTYTEWRDSQLGVPEVISTRVEGEWLIPDGKFLLVSLGLYTVADPEGNAVVHDRVVIIDAEPVVRDPVVSPTGYDQP